MRAGRLCGSFDDQITYLEREASETKLKAQQGRGQKRAKVEELGDLQNMLSNVKVTLLPPNFLVSNSLQNIALIVVSVLLITF